MESIEGILRSGDRRMLHYLASVSWRDGVSSAEVARRCGLGKSESGLRRRRHGRYGHVERRGKEHTLGIIRLKVPIEDRRSEVRKIEGKIWWKTEEY